MRHSCLLLLLLLLACLPASAEPKDPHAEVRGVTISCTTKEFYTKKWSLSFGVEFYFSDFVENPDAN